MFSIYIGARIITDINNANCVKQSLNAIQANIQELDNFDGIFKWFTSDGKYELYSSAKCVIFPKGKTTWEGFVPPCTLKDGDIIYVKDKCELEWCSIIKNCKDGKLYTYVDICIDSNSIYSDKLNILCYCKDMIEYRLATEKEKEKLFNVIKIKGYKWNEETKTLEKLPKFKVGDRVKHISAYTSGTVIKVSDKGYHIEYPKDEGICYINFELEEDYELVPNKFDINDLKPFDKVLVRNSNKDYWNISFFKRYESQYNCPFVCMFSWVKQCIPYENNEYLFNTNTNCSEYYITWE